jgi:hypothetical protein
MQMRLFGVISADRMSRVIADTQKGAGTHKHDRGVLARENPPEFVCVVLSIPRRILRAYYEQSQLEGPKLEIFLQFCVTSPAFNHVYSSSLAVFGKLVKDGDRCRIEGDDEEWAGRSDLHVCALVPTASLHLPAQQLKVSVRMQQEFTTMAYVPQNLPRDVYEVTLADKAVSIMEGLPSQELPLPAITDSINEKFAFVDDTADITFPKLSIADATFTTRITFKKDILSPGEGVKITNVTPCTVTVTIGPFTHKCPFPFPIDCTKVKTRRKKTKYIDIIAPLSTPKNRGGYITNPFPILKDSKGEISNWNVPTIRFGPTQKLDLILELHDKREFKWVRQHMMTIFTADELFFRKTHPRERPSDSMTIFKSSLFDMFCQIAEDKRVVFEVKETKETKEALLFSILGLWLDDNTNSIAAEAYVWMLQDHDIAVREGMKPALQHSSTIVVGKEGLRVWKQTLPSMLERSRDWKHAAGCEFTPGIAFRSTEYPICGCGPDSLRKGTDLKAPSWAIPYTPITISPVFAVPYLHGPSGGGSETERLARAVEAVDLGIGEKDLRKCWKCGKGGRLSVCVGCKVARYCSRGCQEQDWRAHKNHCVELAGKNGKKGGKKRG